MKIPGGAATVVAPVPRAVASCWLEQPVLVIHGDNDIVVATVNSNLLQQDLPNAELILR
jgi:fermentation-respiration switch protein FrsA (DUF1100 family)